MVPDRPSALSIPTSSGVEQNIAVEMICPYEAGKPLREVERELGLTDVTKLASNENPLGPSPRVIDTLNGSRLDLHAYPDYDGWYLRRAVAERLGVAVESVLIGAGSSDLMRVVADAYLAPGNEALVSDICFPVYANLARLAGAEVVAVPLDDDLQYDLERMLGAVTDRTKVVFLASPNNPTGLEIPADELELFLQRIPSGVLCVVDLAYREYVDSAADRDPLDLLRRHPNVLLLHTFSKVYGLAGLRVGYAVAPRDVIPGGRPRRARGPRAHGRVGSAQPGDARLFGERSSRSRPAYMAIGRELRSRRHRAGFGCRVPGDAPPGRHRPTITRSAPEHVPAHHYRNGGANGPGRGRARGGVEAAALTAQGRALLNIRLPSIPVAFGASGRLPSELWGRPPRRPVAPVHPEELLRPQGRLERSRMDVGHTPPTEPPLRARAPVTAARGASSHQMTATSVPSGGTRTSRG